MSAPLLTEYPQLKIIKEMSQAKKLSVYLVGGFLRDYLLGIKGKDFDFAVAKDALKMARAFADKIKGAYVLLDAEHGCARVVKKEKGEIYTFDFADFRAKTFKGDIHHRDFTINTFALNLVELNDDTEVKDILLDLKKGLKDLKAKLIRQTSRNVLKEDPLRILRAFSLRANLGFKIEAKTLQAIKKQKATIRDVSYERIRDEIFKILESKRTATILKEMDRLGLLAEIIPQIKVMFNCQQGGYHHLNVWPHSLEAVVQLEKILDENADLELKNYLNEVIKGNRTRRALLKLGTLLHDIGKPETRREEENDRISFHGHEHVGKHITRHVARLLKLSLMETHMLEDMVRWHLRPGYLGDFKKPSERAVYRYFRDAKDEAVSILVLSLADQRATRGPLTSDEDQKHHEKTCRQLIARWFEEKKRTPFVRLITGDDLIKVLKLKPSPLFGKILTEVEEKQNLGKVTTRKEALELERQIFAKQEKKREDKKH